MRTSHGFCYILPIIILLTGNLLFADEIRFLQVGMLQNWFSSGGCEIEVGRRHVVEDQQDGFRYPAMYKNQDMQAAKGLWIGTTNFSDPLRDGHTYDYKVVHFGPRSLDETAEVLPKQFKLIGQSEPPEVLVNGSPASAIRHNEQLDEIDPDLKSDRLLYNVVNTSMGVTITRKIYAFSQSSHDGFFLYDFVFKNTGVYDNDGNRHNLTLTDVIFFFQYRWAMTKYACSNGYGWAARSATWGHNTIHEILHPNYGDNYRAIYAWHGLHSEFDGNNIGAPNTGSETIAADGFLGAPQFPGVLTIQVDNGPGDNSDAPDQFAHAPYFDSDNPITWPNDQFDADRMADEYEYMSKELPNKPQAEKAQYPHNPGWQDAPFGDTKNGDDYEIGGFSGMTQGIGYGPYMLAPGDSIHIVMAECAGSINWDIREQVGVNWYHGNAPYNLPDGSQTNDRNTYKDAWVFTGRDSLLQAFDYAFSAWNHNLSIDPGPPPPEQFTITSGGDHITLEWSNNPENYDHFGGYQLYRRVDHPDSTFELIFTCGGNTGQPVVQEFVDWNVRREFGYYYSVLSFDDGTVNTIEPGEIIKSSPFLTETGEPATLLRDPSENLQDIRVVPNPYNHSMQEFRVDGGTENEIMFYNLPPKCRIKIYTERGDQIKTIHHTDNSGEDSWNLVTKKGDEIASGLYIAYIEVTEDYYKSGQLVTKKGTGVTRKFIVIR